MNKPKIFIEENNKIMLNCDQSSLDILLVLMLVLCRATALLCSVSGPDCVHTGHRSPARQPPLNNR